MAVSEPVPLIYEYRGDPAPWRFTAGPEDAPARFVIQRFLVSVLATEPEWAATLDRIVYKIMSPAELQRMRDDGAFLGSPADVADGYIHLSCGSQLAATLDKHFSGVDGLMLVAVDLSRLGQTVRWEPARGGQLFPHIYGPLPIGAVMSVAQVERAADGTVRLPA